MPIPEEPTNGEPTVSEEDGYLSIFGEVGVKIPTDKGVEVEKLFAFDINLILLILSILAIIGFMLWSND